MSDLGLDLAKEIERYLPYLRRYARALTGSTKRGDEAVLAGIEALDLDLSYGEIDIMLFSAVDRAVLALLEEADAERSDDALTALALPERRALLLTALEDFTTAQAASIMGTFPEEIDALLADGENKLLAHLATTVMIIEDEPLIAANLSKLAASLGHDLTDIATTKEEAVKLALDTRPTLILSDVMLADGSLGNEAIAEIEKVYAPLVIYITAYPEQLLTGVEAEPAYLIPKPFKPSYVKAVIEQALLTRANAPNL